MDDSAPRTVVDISSVLEQSHDRASTSAERSQLPPTISALYEDYAEQLTATLRKMYGDGPPDPADVAQQAFERLLERGDFASITNLKAFVWRTARNIVLAAKRSARVRSAYDYEVERIYFPLKSDDSTPESIIAARQQLRRINALLLAMPEKRRRAFVLHRLEGLSVAEVGRRLGVNRSSAAKHVARAAAAINLLLMQEEEI
ncbi:MAG: sigma-70 family RNA polymerase sigma factor [Pseudomonadota bacterium]